MIYSPEEDSYLLQESLKIKIPSLLNLNKNLNVLEIGIGSGIQLETLRELGVRDFLGVDINFEAVRLCKMKNFKVKKSDLFSNIPKEEKFDLILFNPPYLPEDLNEDEDSKRITTGGKKGSEIINRFLEEAKSHLTQEGKLFLLVSSLTKGINYGRYSKKIILRKKIFFEELKVLELSKLDDYC